jgi:putative ABC transport system permease protein
VAKVPGFETDNLSVAGQTANYNRLSPRELAAGRFFTEEEARRGQRVAVLGSAIAEALFPGGGAVGRQVNVNGAEYTVTGVYAKAKGSFLGENQMDNLIVIPLETLRIRYPQLNDYQMVLRARPGMRDDAVAEAEAALRRLRQLPPGTENDFALNTPEQIIEQFDSITGVVGVAAIALSSLGLLVGGIGVMNIMLVSVTERTREIGVRKAVGARRVDIVGQFLVEAMALTAAGGVLGVLAAILISAAVGALVPALPSAVPAWAIGAGLSVSMAVGLFFGVWPAVKASRMDPVEALRHE